MIPPTISRRSVARHRHGRGLLSIGRLPHPSMPAPGIHPARTGPLSAHASDSTAYGRITGGICPTATNA